jgi:hypothetical protein
VGNTDDQNDEEDIVVNADGTMEPAHGEVAWEE